jgi:hypothetical protein
LIPLGTETRPPLPVAATVSVTVDETNVAVTLLAALIDTVQAPEPEHAPPHVLKAQPDAADGVSVTDAPRA